MDMNHVKPYGLTGNQLKTIALAAMTCDHVGRQLLPQYTGLLVIGRLAFPVFACMVAEGCKYTKNRKKYLFTMISLAFLCQIVYYIAMRSLYQCVLVTFSLSTGMIYVLDAALKKKTVGAWAVAGTCLTAIYFVSAVLPDVMTGTDFAIDYGFRGVMLPVLAYMGHVKGQKLLLLAAGLILLVAGMGGIQWYSLAAIPLLALYNGKRGNRNLKYLFYVYYPLHLVVIYAISLALQ